MKTALRGSVVIDAEFEFDSKYEHKPQRYRVVLWGFRYASIAMVRSKISCGEPFAGIVLSNPAFA